MPKNPRSGVAHAALAFIVLSSVASLAPGCNDAKVKSSPPAVATEPGKPSGGGGSGSGTSGPPSGGVHLPDAGAPSPAAPDAGAAGGKDAGGPCKPATCTPAGGKYCGQIGDGCGGRLDCGDACPMGQSCGGGGTKNLCGAPPDPSCQSIACEQRGGRLCGRVGDGCGGAKDCGDCPGGETCGGTVANVCGNGGAGGPAASNCPAGQETTVSGTVLAPTPAKFGSADPLYNALVYVPSQPVQPFAAGVACDLCGGAVSGAPLANALSGPDGKFTLRHVPAGDNVPLVIQIGRWRRQVSIPKVTACGNTALPPELTRLPRNQAEGAIPQMAIATGTYDQFECVLRKIGVDEAEFTPPSGNGRIHIYKYDGFGLAQPVPPGDDLVKSAATLAKYDMVLFPCDDPLEKPTAFLANLREYTARGGRLFLTDWAYAWLKDGGVFENTMAWLPEDVLLGDDFQTVVDQSFPKGMAFAEWLKLVGASTQLGRLPIHDPYEGDSYFDQVRAPTQRWLYTEKGTKPSTVQHFTFNTPIGAAPAQQCGRVVYSNFHVADEKTRPFLGGLEERGIFPRDCSNAPMTPQEKALEFMLFDASACILPDTEKPQVFQPPPIAPPPPPPQVE